MQAKEQSLVLPDEVVINRIYLIRNQKVMLDKDLAELYQVKPIRLREQVKRNISRFPSHFMFQLSEKEIDYMVSQNAILSRQHLGGSKPYVFSEHGILMLANVLKNDRAIQMSIRIIEIFIRLRELLLTHKDILLKLEQLEKEVTRNNADIRQIFEVLKHLLHHPEKERTSIGFKQKESNH